MKSRVKQHKRVGKNKVSVVKTHDRSNFRRGQHPNSVKYRFGNLQRPNGVLPDKKPMHPHDKPGPNWKEVNDATARSGKDEYSKDIPKKAGKKYKSESEHRKEDKHDPKRGTSKGAKKWLKNVRGYTDRKKKGDKKKPTSDKHGKSGISSHPSAQKSFGEFKRHLDQQVSKVKNAVNSRLGHTAQTTLEKSGL